MNTRKPRPALSFDALRDREKLCPRSEPAIIMDLEDAVADDRRRAREEGLARLFEMVDKSKHPKLVIALIRRRFGCWVGPRGTNAELAKKWPVILERKEPPADADEWLNVKDKLQYLKK